MDAFRQVTFTPFNHQPGDRQGSLPIDQVDHEGDTLMSHFTPINDEDQLADLSQMDQQLTYKGQIISGIIDAFVLDPATVAFDPAICSGLVGSLASNAGQLAI